MKDLFDENLEEYLKKGAPLADRIRPLDFDCFFGQDELVKNLQRPGLCKFFCYNQTDFLIVNFVFICYYNI